MSDDLYGRARAVKPCPKGHQERYRNGKCALCNRERCKRAYKPKLRKPGMNEEQKKAYQKAFGGKKLKVVIIKAVSKTKKKEDGTPQTYFNHRITGVVQALSAATEVTDEDDE